MKKHLKTLLVAFAGCMSMLFSGCSLTPVDTYSAELSSSEITLEKDSTQTLSIKSVKSGDVELSSQKYSYTWTSNDTRVASITTNGVVKGIDAGTTNVVANIRVYGAKIIKALCKITVTDPDPVTIELNKTDIEVQQGKSVQISAFVEHCADKSVTWSSDSNLITVNFNGVVHASTDSEIGSTATITAASVYDPNAKASCKITVIERQNVHYDYTIMLYMSGSTLENNSSSNTTVYPGLFSQDIIEILSLDLPDSFKIIIQTGGTTKWALGSKYIYGATSISNDYLQRWEVADKKLKLIETLSTNKMASEESFENFLRWGLDEYSADQMGVIVSGHGSGVGGCALDDNYTYSYGLKTYKHYLNIPEIAEASRNALQTSDRSKFTWLGFDCCLMGCADIASVMCDYYDYMVASQELEEGEGWVHNKYMNYIASNTLINPEVLLPQIATSFVSNYHTESYCTVEEPCMQTLSVLDLSKMPAFTTAFNNYVASVGTNYAKYKVAFTNSYNSFGRGCYGLVDFESYLDKLNIQFPSYSVANVKDALHDVVISNQYCSRYTTSPCGLNAFFPECVSKVSGDRLQPGKEDYTGSYATKFSAYQTMCLNSNTWIW